MVDGTQCDQRKSTKCDDGGNRGAMIRRGRGVGAGKWEGGGGDERDEKDQE